MRVHSLYSGVGVGAGIRGSPKTGRQEISSRHFPMTRLTASFFLLFLSSLRRGGEEEFLCGRRRSIRDFRYDLSISIVLYRTERYALFVRFFLSSNKTAT